MSILSTREWATLIWGLLFLVYIMCHKEIRKSFWKVIEYYGAVTPQIRQAGNRLSGLPETNYCASLLA